jgi:hypothetical protein
MDTFPFGRPVEPCTPSADGPRPLFVLGAYPSALHIRWTGPPEPDAKRPVSIRALPVDNEPTPFWIGDDETEQIGKWKQRVDWTDEWGVAEPVGHLNGSSGRWIDECVLQPLGHTRSEAHITDCLDTYRASDAVARAIEERFAPFCERHDLERSRLAAHPSESGIVKEALDSHAARLRSELSTAQPELIVTLGNAALRVVCSLADGDPSLPGKLAINDKYGERHVVSIDKRPCDVLPLAHPGAPERYQDTHSMWVLRARS